MGWGKLVLGAMLFTRALFGAFAIDAGVYATHLEDRFYVANENRSKVSHFTGMLRLRPMISLGKNWYFEPALGILLPWHASVDGSAKVFTSHFDLGLTVPIFSFLALRVGPGVQWTGILSKGEVIEQNNGNGTSDFYMPGRFSSGYLFTVQGALVIKVKRISVSFEAYVSNVVNRLRRTIDGAVMLGVTL